jgi:hypothetical protein
MATAMTGVYRNTARATQMIQQCLMNSAKQIFPASGVHAGRRKPRKVWTNTADPAVDAGDQGTYPVAKGDWVIRTNAGDIESIWLCTVAPAAGTAATFVEVIA